MVSASVSVTGIGVSLATSSATALAEAMGIDAGSGNDSVTQRGSILANAKATAVAVQVSFTGVGVAGSAGAVWDGGTRTTARAAGIAGGSGDDTISYSGELTARSEAGSVAVAAALAGKGVAAATTSSTTLAEAVGIDAGEGDDLVTSSGTITADADAEGTSVSAALSLVGVSAAGEAPKAVWEGGTTATADATGIAAGAGSDRVVNSASISSNARSKTTSIAVKATLAGIAAGGANSTASAISTGVDLGEGDNHLYNTGAIVVTATAEARALEVSVVGAGASGIQNEIKDWAQDTRSEASATGISGGTGNDIVRNPASVDVTAEATTDATNATVVLLGYGNSRAGGAASSNAVGISTGAGIDGIGIAASGSITVRSKASAKAGSVSVQLAGAISGEAGTEAEATATGIDSGEGSDTVANAAAIDVSAAATASADSVTVDLVGSGKADMEADASAASTGIATGSGDDKVTNSGSVTAGTWSNDPKVAMASVSIEGSTWVLAGSGSSGAAAQAASDSTGIDLGEGNDKIVNSGGVQAYATSRAYTDQSSYTFAGAAGSSGTIGAIANATGIAGGDGIDDIDNAGYVMAASRSDSKSSGSAASFAGSTDVRASADASATAIGIDSGEGDDEVTNSGSVGAVATSQVEIDTNSEVFAGTPKASSNGAATASASGIDTGAGNNTVRNDAAVLASASAYGSAKASADSSFMNNEAHAEADAVATATGIAAGNGDDKLGNGASGSVRAEALASVMTDGFSDESSTATSVGNVAAAIGIQAGEGRNEIANAGQVLADAKTYINVTATASSMQYAAYSTASVEASADSTGLASGSGNDTITNERVDGSEGEAPLVVAIAEAKGNAVATYDAPHQDESTAGVVIGAHAVGVSAGGGENVVTNGGEIIAIATADAETRAEANTEAAWTTVTHSDPVAAAEATGIRSEGGSDHINMLADSKTNASAKADATAYSYAEENGYASASATAIATGIDSGDGASWIDIEGTVNAAADANIEVDVHVNSDLSTNLANADSVTRAEAAAIRTGSGVDDIEILRGASLVATATAGTENPPADGNARADESATFTVTDTASAAGVSLGAGTNAASNLGSILVEAVSDSAGFVTASTWYPHIKAVATATVTTSSNASGIIGGSGNDTVTNGKAQDDGSTDALATIDVSAIARGYALADDDGAEHLDKAYATSTFTATAKAMALDAGNNSATNHGTLTVTAEATGSALSYATTKALANWSVSVVTATAVAAGIESGAGVDSIDNGGDIDVTAKADADAEAVCAIIDDAGSSANSTAGAWADASATAYGISSGTGNDVINNSGSIAVVAEAGATAFGDADAGFWFGTEYETSKRSSKATAAGIYAEGGNNHIVNLEGGEIAAWATGATDRAEYGIRTGAGDDLIENNGTIEAWTRASSGHAWAAGIGIDSGAGNDTVTLGNGSSVTGDILLGTGNDTLQVTGTGNLSGIAWGGAGTDLLEIEGAGSFSSSQTREFENFLKYGAGTLTLGGASVFESLEVASGSLRVEGGLALTEGSRLATWVYGDGTNGLISVGGELGLDGALSVARGAGAFRDGTSFDIIEADSLSGAFASLELPAATALLSFSLVPAGATGYRVVASAAAFTSVARTADELAIASVFDTLLPAATGDLSLVLGEFQSLASADYVAAFDSLGPGVHGAAMVAALSAIDGFSGAVFSRLSALEPSGASASPTLDRATIKRLGHSTASPARSGSSAKAEHGFWLSGFGQWGRSSPDEGGFNFSVSGTVAGWDATFGHCLSAGIGAGYSGIETVLDSGTSRTDGMTGSAYAAWVPGTLRFDGALAWTRQLHVLSREIEFGTIDRVASSDHSGDAINAAFGAGLTLGAGAFSLSPSLRARYVYVSEEAFTETGADSVSLAVAARSDHSLCSDLGLALAFELGSGPRGISADLSALWRHDFLSGSAPIEASFADAPDEPFLTQPPVQAADGFLVGAGLLIKTGTGFSVSLRYDCEIRDGFYANGLSGSVRLGL
ncbi:MAG TPA: autotransporter domain-containing protein [Spirochaetales bacterium]|nr:autotransporter domain-containing protein [Spirochaetales bacterium]